MEILQSRKIFSIIFVSAMVICIFLTWKSFLKNECLSEKKISSVFYQRMHKADEFDFIKTAEKELENINNYLQANKNNPSFNLFISIEKNCLINEIENKKLYIYSKKDGIKDTPIDYKTYQKLYPEQVEKFKEKGNILEYDKIDYISLYKQKR